MKPFSARYLLRAAWAILALVMGVNLQGGSVTNEWVGTYSIVAYDPRAKEWGVAVQSKFFGVGSVVPWAKAGVGAIATQAKANVKYGPAGLELLGSGKSAKKTIEALTSEDDERELRQVGMVDSHGGAAAFTGSGCHDAHAQFVGTNFCAQGNTLANERVVSAMAEEYERARAIEGTELADWLMAALDAAEREGGDKRGRQSAALLVVREGGGLARANDRYIDLRVEDHAEPLKELARLLAIHKEFFTGPHRKKPH